MLCSDCGKRNECKELCKEAKEYADRDYCGQREMVFKGMAVETELDVFRSVSWDISGLSSTRLKVLILGLSTDGMSTWEIAYHLPCSQQYIQQVTSKRRDKPTKL